MKDQHISVTLKTKTPLKNKESEFLESMARMNETPKSPKNIYKTKNRRSVINASEISNSVLGRKIDYNYGGFNTIGTGDDTERGRSVLSNILNEQ